jgi:hypothetical protein
MLRVALLTAQRVSKIAEMRWSDIVEHRRRVVAGGSCAAAKSCPSGYASEASWCVPMKGAPVALPKGKDQ